MDATAEGAYDIVVYQVGALTDSSRQWGKDAACKSAWQFVLKWLQATTLAEVFACAVHDINPVTGVVRYDSSDPVCIQ
ncbi:hypothetical protein BBG47_27525 [Paenibacillus sp. KS1]|uniref:hypothetical protein n=1 Tax=Paenibacillus sp. KS1 TaxID=1849249 RepID=UPI0008064F05|nr:hypothetical protein [Paenibacillus sp. KS1]OBY76366.1 hypothetical protein BBG47_27525 [Paenibacillus sp. KS1]